MKYKANDNQIEIDPQKTPIKKVLGTIARVSYELARPVGMGFLQSFDTKSSDVDFSQYVSPDGVRMDYVNGRMCKTYVRVKGKKLIFNSWLFQGDRGSPEVFLNKVVEALESEQKTKGLKKITKSNKPIYWNRVEIAASQYGIQVDPSNARESRLKVALALDRTGKEMEAVEIMTGRDFMKKADGILLLVYKMSGDSPEKFYRGFADIDGC